MNKMLRLPLALTTAIVALLLSAGALHAEPSHRYVIQCNNDCTSIAAAVRQIPGASIDYQFKNVAGLAVTVPLSAVATLQARTDVTNIAKDIQIAAPAPVNRPPVLTAQGVQVLSVAQLPGFVGARPADYSFNNDLIGASALQAQGTLGTGVVVAVIDSGTANNAAVVSNLAGSVIGGESLVPATEDAVTSATSTHNSPHGTWVGSMIAGHSIFLFPKTSSFVQSLQLHAPNSVIACAVLGCPANLAGIPVVGVAPAAKLYALKVFNSAGGGASNTRIAAAMDRAITLRKNFNNGVPALPVNPGCGAENNPCVYNSLNIQVVNMSLGGLTLFAARDLEDQITSELVKAGIFLAVAAGNSGPAALTVESPGTGLGSLTAAASATATHGRVLYDVIFGLGFGDLVFPFSGIQTAGFSSRGPTADGRVGVHLITNGFANLVQSANGSLSLVNGTSFAAPTVAGAGALLRQKFPTASAGQLRNALIDGANLNLVADGSGRFDQGAGYLDIPAAAAKLAAGHVSSSLPPAGLSSPIVDLNLLPLGITAVNLVNNQYTTHVSNLKPGQVAQFYVRAFSNTDRLTVTVKNLTPALPPAQQNLLFGDDIVLTVVDAPTSSSFLLASQFVDFDTTVTAAKPQSGFLRVAIQGSPNNAGPVSADLVIQTAAVNLGAPTSAGTVKQGEQDVVRLQVPAGTSQLTFQLSWVHDWGFYPTNDLDLVIVDPNGNVDLSAATLNSPERAVFLNPTPGVWTAQIQGFQINSGVVNNQDLWTLHVRADGQAVRRLP